MRLNNRGFSYKEFFAVIVIMVILIMAIVPAMLAFIQHSKDDVLTDSVIIFRKQVELEILSYINGGNDVADGCYFVTEKGDVCLGNYKDNKCDAESLKVDVDGLKPTGGYLGIKSCKINDIHDICIDNMFVNIEDDEYVISRFPDKKFVCEK